MPEAQDARAPVARLRCGQGHPAAVTTCVGCGQFLCRTCGDASPLRRRCPECATTTAAVAWEDPHRPWLAALGATLAQLLRPDRFYAQLPLSGGLRGPLGFAALTAAVGGLCEATVGLVTGWLSLSWVAALARAAAADPKVMKQASPTVRALLAETDTFSARLFELLAGSTLLHAAAAPVVAAVGVLVLSALSHPIARWLGGTGTFEATVRVIAYAAGAQVLAVIPGAPLVLGVILVTVGAKRAHDLSTGRALAVATWWIPPVGIAAAVSAGWLALTLLRTLR